MQGLQNKVKLLDLELRQAMKTNERITEALQKSQLTNQHLITQLKDKPSSAILSSKSTSASSKGMEKIIETLNLENRLLLEFAKDLMNERCTAQCKGLLLEQVLELHDIEKEARILSTAKSLHDMMYERATYIPTVKQLSIQEDLKPPSVAVLSPRNIEQPSIANSMVEKSPSNVNKISAPPTKEVLLMHKELDQFKKVAHRASAQIISLQNEKQELLKVNFVNLN